VLGYGAMTIVVAAGAGALVARSSALLTGGFHAAFAVTGALTAGAIVASALIRRALVTQLTHPLGGLTRATRLQEAPMSAKPGARKSRPTGAPAYYLGRPASWWITATARQRAGSPRTEDGARYRRRPCGS
jgi:hypothetical protein